MDIGDKRNGGAVMVDKSPLKLAIVWGLVSTKGERHKISKVIHASQNESKDPPSNNE